MAYPEDSYTVFQYVSECPSGINISTEIERLTSEVISVTERVAYLEVDVEKSSKKWRVFV